MKRVGILRGGEGSYYHSSLKRGGDILSYIFENLGEKYKTLDIFIDKDNVWHLNGMPIRIADLSKKVDMVWNVSHPTISITLNSFGIPHVGANAFSHVLGSDSKHTLRGEMAKFGVSMPRSVIIPVYQKDFDGPRERYAIKKAKEVFEKFSSPWIVRSYTTESGMGIHFAKTFPELIHSIEDGVKHGVSILVEEFISGKVASVHSVPGFRGKSFYVFPPVGIFGILSQQEKDKLALLSNDLHYHLGIKHYLKSNFILSKSGKVYLFDLECTPNLKPYSHFAQACESVGAKMEDVVEHILEQA